MSFFKNKETKYVLVGAVAAVVIFVAYFFASAEYAAGTALCVLVVVLNTFFTFFWFEFKNQRDYLEESRKSNVAVIGMCVKVGSATRVLAPVESTFVLPKSVMQKLNPHGDYVPVVGRYYSK